jgi:membrane protease YdiL (CAAX protease family)
MNANSFDLFALTLLLIMTIALPLLGVWDFQRLKRWIAEGRSDARTRTYNWILVMEWGLTLGLLAWWLADGRSLARLGLVPAAGGWQWLAIGLGLVGTGFMIWQMFSVLRNPDELAKVRDKMGELSGLAPQTPGEVRLFGAVSLTAGVCEEILYRGLLMAALAPAIGTWPAVVLSSLIFGLGHAYQGPGGIAKTALIGLVMALLTVFSGSLFIPMLLHTVIDLTSGRLMGAAQRSEPAPAT